MVARALAIPDEELSLGDLLPGLKPHYANPWTEHLHILSPVVDVQHDPWLSERRENQTPPDGAWWSTWAIMAGRGFGKTRTGAEFSREQLMFHNRRYWAFIAPTARDARDIMIEGPSGFLIVCERYGWKPHYEPSKLQITCPNGAIIYVRSAEEPDRIRGLEVEGAWCDEVSAWKDGKGAWDMLQFGARRKVTGSHPIVVATFTPKPVPVVKAILADLRDEERPSGTVVLSTGSTFDNAANLSEAFLAKVERDYEGTRLGRQELHGELLLDIPGALWSLSNIEELRIVHREDDIDIYPTDQDLWRIVVGVDPMVGEPDKEAEATEEISETGIVVAGMDNRDEAYILEDASLAGEPHEWATAAIRAYRRWRADAMVVEINNGGLMVRDTIHAIDPTVNVKMVTASRGKLTRAEPISAFYRIGRVHHVGVYPKLEDQLTTYTGKGKSPDRLDALVWALTEMMIGASAAVLDDEALMRFQHMPGWG